MRYYITILSPRYLGDLTDRKSGYIFVLASASLINNGIILQISVADNALDYTMDDVLYIEDQLEYHIINKIKAR